MFTFMIQKETKKKLSLKPKNCNLYSFLAGPPEGLKLPIDLKSLN